MLLCCCPLRVLDCCICRYFVVALLGVFDCSICRYFVVAFLVFLVVAYVI